MSEKNDNSLAPGSIIAGYRIERELGRGAMAIVYLATQLNLERLIALKVLTQELAADEEFVGRFMNEAKAAGKMSHPNIIQAYDAGVAEGDVYYFAMEYVEGEDLDARINREGFMSPANGLAIGLDIASALDYGWRKAKLTHGDIKPENIMISKSGYTRLADFGLAKVIGTEKVDFKTTGIMLTPAYAAPEVIRGRLLGTDCRSDIYSFGATMYQVLAGFPPFPGDDADDVMRRQVEEPLTPLIERNPGIHREISDFIGQLLSKEPDDRPPEWANVVPKLHALRERAKAPPTTSATAAAAPAKAAGNVKSRKLMTAAAKPIQASVTIAKPVAPAAPLIVARPVGTPPSQATRREGEPAPPPLVRPGIPIRSATGSQPVAAEPRSISKGTVAAILVVAILINVFALWMLNVGMPKAKPGGTPGRGTHSQPGAPNSGPALTPALQEWARVRKQCADADHPAKRLDMLDKYKQAHGSELPADFDSYYKDCEDALKWRRMTEDLERRQQEQQGDGGGKIDSGTKTGGGKAMDVEKMLEQ